MTIWTQHRASLRKHLKEDSLDNFLQWSTIQATMFVGTGASYTQAEYDEIMTDKHIIMPVISECEAGNPQVLFGWTSGNLIHQYYHLKQWLDLTRQDITKIQGIIEVGAGYGAMALICYRLGFKGRYYIIDLPELEQVQAHYLNQTIPEARSSIHWLQLSSSVKWFGNLFIASHSLSEMPARTRERLLSQVAAKEYLFASSYEFEGIDNAGWFQQLAGGIMGIDWKFYPHRHQENAFYMVGIQL